LNKARPILKTFPGWKKSISGAAVFDALPVEARDYITFIEEYCQTEVGIVSVGYERTQTIIREDVWT
jgi:adenylosuccinate synthase